VRLPDLPVVSQILDAGPDDRGFDALLLAGPVVVALAAVLGRTPLTEALAAGYVASITLYVGYRGTVGA